MKKSYKKNTKGIALIALITSIIIILVLAGIGINMLSRRKSEY